MKVFYYTPAECGLDQFPAGLLRLGGQAQAVSDPASADCFVCPPTLRDMGPARVAALPYLRGREHHHVFFNVAEDVNIHYPPGPLYLRCDATREMKARWLGVMGWPWPVADLFDAGADAEPFTHDVVFQGWASTQLTNIVCDALRSYPRLRSYIQTHNFFYGYHDGDPAYAPLRASFIDGLRHARLSLVPRSIPAGVVRYRFYEAMSAGRVPVHLCDGRVLPWQNEIDWDRCSIHLKEASAFHIGPILAGWLAEHSDDQIRAMGAYGREMWLRYLDRRRWPELFTEAVRKWLSI